MSKSVHTTQPLSGQGGYGTMGGQPFDEGSYQKRRQGRQPFDEESYQQRGQGYAYDPDGRPPSTDKSLLRRGDEDYDVDNKITMSELVCVPWVLLVLVLVCYLFAGVNGQIFILWLIPIVLLSLNAAFIRYNYKQGNSDEVVLGFMALAAVVISTAVGVYCNLAMLEELHRLNQGASYFNVNPAQDVASYIDGTSFVFTNTTHADVSRFFGYVDAGSPNRPTYCVAPVTNGEAAFTSIQYWAAGINCCGKQKPFTCGAAQKRSAHGALLLNPDLQESKHQEFFAKAITGAQDSFALTGGNGYLLLDWKDDPIKYTNDLWYHSWFLMAVFAAVYLAISGMSAFVILPMLKAED